MNHITGRDVREVSIPISEVLISTTISTKG